MTEKEENPGSLIGISGSYWKSFVLQAGVKLDLFTLIGDEEPEADHIAGKLNGDPRGVSALLNALTAMGLLEKHGDRYANTPLSKKFLSKASRRYVGYIIMHHHNLVDAWSRLDQAVLTGKPVRKDRIRTGQERENFLMGMFNMAMATAPGLVRQVDLKGRRHLLDLGGGPGTYAIQFCLKNPGLKATVYDLPTTRPFAEKTIAGFGLSAMVDFAPGDYSKDGIPGTYDAAWLSHILHGMSPQSCQTVIQKAAGVLSPGGRIFVHEFILEDTLAGPLFPALFSLNMLVNTDGGRSYSEEQIRGMLAKAGIKNIARMPFTGPTESGVLMGER